MPKPTSDTEFMSRLTARAATAAPAGRMKLNTPPSGSNKSLDDVLSAQEAITASEGSTTEQEPTVIGSSAEVGVEGSPTGRWMSIDDLDTSQWNARVHRSPERIREIASDIAATLQKSPVLVTPNPNLPGRFYVVDGETRFRAVKSLNRKRIWVLDVDVDPNDPLAFYVASFKQTDATQKISPIDQAIRWGELVENKHATFESIAERLELNPSTVSRMLSYRRYPARVLEFMHQHADRFPYSVAAALAPVLDTGIDEDRVLALCQKIVDEDYSRRAIEAMVKNTDPTEKQTRRSALISRSVKKGAKPVGSFRTYESGALEFKLSASHGLSAKSVLALERLLDVATDLLSTSDDVDLLEELPRRLKLGSDK
jgi:ParB family transcriptional regulator, chromosome partitioning protein